MLNWNKAFWSLKKSHDLERTIREFLKIVIDQNLWPILKHFTFVNYDFRLVITCKLFIITTLELYFTSIEALQDWPLICSPDSINQLSQNFQISYDFSQRLVKTTSVIELSDNPWICSCTSQITDLVRFFTNRYHTFCLGIWEINWDSTIRWVRRSDTGGRASFDRLTV